MLLCRSMLSTGVFQNTIFLDASLKLNNFFNNCISILQIQSNESLHERLIIMCRCILISCKEKKSKSIEEKWKPYFWTKVVLVNNHATVLCAKYKESITNCVYLYPCEYLCNNLFIGSYCTYVKTRFKIRIVNKYNKGKMLRWKVCMYIHAFVKYEISNIFCFFSTNKFHCCIQNCKLKASISQSILSKWNIMCWISTLSATENPMK